MLFDRVWKAVEDSIDQPLRTRKTYRFRLAGDLFHEDVPDGWIMRIFNVMAHAPWHRFQILTKRPERMRDVLIRWHDLAGENLCDFKGVRGPDATRAAHPSGRGQLFAAMLDAMGEPPPGAAFPTFDWMEGMLRWPASVFDHVWLGTSVEDQATADERIPQLLATPAAVRFLSAEPLLGPIELEGITSADVGIYALTGIRSDGSGPSGFSQGKRLDWVICGGESGRHARPMHPDWARSLQGQCQAAGVAFFFKQWGEWAPRFVAGIAETDPPGKTTPRAMWHDVCGLIEDTLARPDHLDFYSEGHVFRVGKTRAGRLLDGREWNQMPGATG